MIKCCKGCEERYLGCHDHCEKYLTELRASLEVKKKMRNEKLKDYPMIQVCIDSQIRSIKKKARKP